MDVNGFCMVNTKQYLLFAKQHNRIYNTVELFNVHIIILVTMLSNEVEVKKNTKASI